MGRDSKVFQSFRAVMVKALSPLKIGNFGTANELTDCY